MLTNKTVINDVTGWLDATNVDLAPARESAKTLGWRAYRRTKSMLTGKSGTDYR